MMDVPSQQTSVPLSALRAGDTALVVGITAEQMAAKRLADLGFVPGVRIELIRRGAPCIVRIEGTRIGLGTQLQESIHTVPA